MKKLNTMAKLGIATTMAFGAVAPAAMMIQPIHAQEVDGMYNDHDVKNLDCELKGSLVYTGGPQEQKVEVKKGKVVLEEGKDYELEGNVATEVGEYTLKIKGINEYSGEKEMKFQIKEQKKVEQTDIKNCEVTLLNNLVYNEKAQTQEVKLTYGNQLLVEGKDYVVEGNTVTSPGNYTMKITGMGENFTGEMSVPFTVELREDPASKANIANCNVELINQLVYNGQAQVQQVRIQNGNQVLVEGKDYTLTNNVAKEAGNYTLTVTGIGDYRGEVSVQFSIKKADVEKVNLSKCNIELVNKLTENGKFQTQKVKVMNGNQILQEGVDYTITNNTAKEAGTYTMTINGKGNVTGSVKVQFTVAKNETKAPVHTSTKSNTGLFAGLAAASVAALAGIAVIFNRKKGMK